MLRRNKKGISEILGYVLLILVAVGIAGAVFSFLRASIPKEKVECPDGISLIVKEFKCAGNYLNITLENRGLFSADGALIKIGSFSRVEKEILNCPGGLRSPGCGASFNIGGGLKPGRGIGFNITYAKKGNFELEIGPVFETDDGNLILCSGAIVTQNVMCS